VLWTMGSQASVGEEITAWASVSDLALATRKMRVVPALAAELQIKVIRRLWRSLRWVPANEIILRPGEPNDRLVVVVQGEAEAMFHGSNCRYIPLLPAGSFVGEIALLSQPCGSGSASIERTSVVRAASSRAGNWTPSQAWRDGELWIDFLWPLRTAKNAPPMLPEGILSMVETFLRKCGDGPRFRGRVRTTRRSLLAEFTRAELASIVEDAASNSNSDESALAAAEAARSVLGMEARCDALQNVTALGVRACELGVQDMAALRVVCEGPIRVTCGSAGEGPGFAALGRGFAAWLPRSPLEACTGAHHQHAGEVQLGGVNENASVRT